jgi:hypothetical protein
MPDAEGMTLHSRGRGGPRYIPGKPLALQTGPPYQILWHFGYQPGDTAAFTMAVESIGLTYPGRYRMGFYGAAPDLFSHNPYITPGLDKRDSAIIGVRFPAIGNLNNKPMHFGQALCEWVSAKLGVPVPLEVNTPRFYFSLDELNWIPPWKDYALILCGAKSDYPAKYAGRQTYQQAADWLRSQGITPVQVGHPKDHHPLLDGVENMIGKTTLRQLLLLAKHAKLATGGISFLMHACAGVGTPYIAMHGGREHTCWTDYPQQTNLSNVGSLPCCQSGPCWRAGTKSSPCELPVFVDGETVPQCHLDLGGKAIIQAAEKILASAK